MQLSAAKRKYKTLNSTAANDVEADAESEARAGVEAALAADGNGDSLETVERNVPEMPQTKPKYTQHTQTKCLPQLSLPLPCGSNNLMALCDTLTAGQADRRAGKQTGIRVSQNI